MLKTSATLRLSDVASSRYLNMISALNLFDTALQSSQFMPQNYWKDGSGDQVEWREGCSVGRHTESFCATQKVRLLKPRAVENLGKFVIDTKATLDSYLILHKFGSSSLTWNNVLRLQLSGSASTVAIGQRMFVRCDSRTHRPLKFTKNERDVLEGLRVKEEKENFGCKETEEALFQMRHEAAQGVGGIAELDFNNVQEFQDTIISNSHTNFG